jgi:hypothetical protein
MSETTILAEERLLAQQQLPAQFGKDFDFNSAQ